MLLYRKYSLVSLVMRIVRLFILCIIIFGIIFLCIFFHQKTRVETETGKIQKNRYDTERLRYELIENSRRTSFVYHNREFCMREERKQGCARNISAISPLPAEIRRRDTPKATYRLPRPASVR